MTIRLPLVIGIQKNHYAILSYSHLSVPFHKSFQKFKVNLKNPFATFSQKEVGNIKYITLDNDASMIIIWTLVSTAMDLHQIPTAKNSANSHPMYASRTIYCGIRTLQYNHYRHLLLHTFCTYILRYSCH